MTCMMEDSLRQERRDKQAAPLDSAHPDDHRVVLSGSWPPRDANSPCARPPKSRDILGEEGGKKEGGGSVESESRKEKEKNDSTSLGPRSSGSVVISHASHRTENRFGLRRECSSEREVAIIGDLPCVRLCCPSRVFLLSPSQTTVYHPILRTMPMLAQLTMGLPGRERAALPTVGAHALETRPPRNNCLV